MPAWRRYRDHSGERRHKGIKPTGRFLARPVPRRSPRSPPMARPVQRSVTRSDFGFDAFFTPWPDGPRPSSCYETSVPAGNGDGRWAVAGSDVAQRTHWRAAGPTGDLVWAAGAPGRLRCVPQPRRGGTASQHRPRPVAGLLRSGRLRPFGRCGAPRGDLTVASQPRHQRRPSIGAGKGSKQEVVRHGPPTLPRSAT